MTEDRDPYAVLQLPSSAGPDEVAAAYRAWLEQGPQEDSAVNARDPGRADAFGDAGMGAPGQAGSTPHHLVGKVFYRPW